VRYHSLADDWVIENPSEERTHQSKQREPDLMVKRWARLGKANQLLNANNGKRSGNGA